MKSIWKTCFLTTGVVWLNLLFFAGSSSPCVAEEILYEQKIRAWPFHIVVPVVVDGIPVNMVLDTGTRGPAFDTSMEAHLGSPIGNTKLSSFGGEAKTRLYATPAMTLGRWTLLPAKALVIDQAPLSALVGKNVDGIVGIDSFGSVAIEMDFGGERLRFLRGYQAQGAVGILLPNDKLKGRKFVPIRIDIGGPHIRAEIAGVRFEPIIDTGSTGFLKLRHDTFEKLERQGAITTETQTEADNGFGVNGPYQIQRGRFNEGNLLGVDLKGAPVQDADAPMDTIGLEFLLQFHSVLDLAGRNFYFERGKNEPPIDVEKTIGAVLLAPEGRCRVVAPPLRGGPAEQAGLRKDDIIIKLGPIDAAGFSTLALYELCATHAGETLELEFVRRGETQTIHARLQLAAKQFLYPRAQ